jgi:hypothetical protein
MFNRKKGEKMSAISPVATLIKQAIEVKLIEPNGMMGTRRVTFDFKRQDEPQEGYLCQECQCYSPSNFGAGSDYFHTKNCTVIDKENRGNLIIVIGWSIANLTSSPFHGVSSDDLNKVVVTAIAQSGRNEGVSEEELAKTWNEGNPIPISPVSVEKKTVFFR